MSEQKTGKLYIISTPIGNPDDITFRAINSIKRSDAVICEEYKEGAKFLKSINIKKEMMQFNEHSSLDDLLDIMSELQSGKRLSLISDCGTPLIADPGNELVRSCVANSIPIEVVPGASSILTALVASNLPTDEFVFAGFLGRTDDSRDNNLKDLSKETRTVVLLVTPYRINKLLESASKIIPDRQAYLGMNLTMPFESNHYGTFKELHKKFKDEKLKAEAVICFEGNYFEKNRRERRS